MNNILKNIGILSIAGLLVLPLTVFAQLSDNSNNENGLRGAPRVYKYGARTAALGDATIGDNTELSVINMNPAALSFIQDVLVLQINTIQNWENNLMLENATFPLLKTVSHTFAGQFAYHHGGFEQTNILGAAPLPQPQIEMYQFDLAYAFNFRNVLSFGILNNFTLAQNEIAQYWTYYPILGIMYAPSESISYGMAFRGLGRSVTYNFHSGGQTTLASQNLRESLELGATLHLPVDTDKTYLSLSIANEKRFGEDGIWYKAGMEIQRVPFLAFRGGIMFQPEAKVYAPRFGLGIVTDIIQLDYAISYDKRLYERFHQLGLTLHLDNLRNL